MSECVWWVNSFGITQSDDGRARGSRQQPHHFRRNGRPHAVGAQFRRILHSTSLPAVLSLRPLSLKSHRIRGASRCSADRRAT